MLSSTHRSTDSAISASYPGSELTITSEKGLSVGESSTTSIAGRTPRDKSPAGSVFSVLREKNVNEPTIFYTRSFREEHQSKVMTNNILF